MWLIHTLSRELHEFVDARHAPPYAILSHRWGDDEVSFKDYRKGRVSDTSGYQKIVKCCQFARDRGQRWVWIGYAYLRDVTYTHSSDELIRQFRSSGWFKRGWTLQELLAPGEVLFLTAEWKFIGSKTGQTGLYDGRLLARSLASITGIPDFIVTRANTSDELSARSVAEKMTWASRRETTRLEDSAYCLLGIFGINMPLLYGEGSKAFQRLQMEIMSCTVDESIFAWTWSKEVPGGGPLFGMLANGPQQYSPVRGCVSWNLHERSAYVTTGRGIEFTIRAGSDTGFYRQNDNKRMYLLRLNCATKQTKERQTAFVVFLEEQPCGHFRRVFIGDIQTEDEVINPTSWQPVNEDRTICIHPLAGMPSTCRLGLLYREGTIAIPRRLLSS